jgi:elongation factor Ts
MMEDIKKLRSRTGCGIADCKQALDEAGNDLDKAIEVLRKKGIAKAAKRSDRETSQGVIKLAVSDDHKEGYILEINAETDFVVRNEKFQEFANQVFEVVKSQKPVDREALLSLSMGDNTVKESLEILSGTIGERLDIKQYAVLSSKGTVAVYAHAGGTIGVLIALDQAGKDELAYDVAMQIAATDPKYINPEDVDEAEINKEKDVYREQLLKEGKPEEMIEKILVGKINKYFEEVCLTKQEFIKDDKQKVEDLLNGVKVEKFIRYSL